MTDKNSGAQGQDAIPDGRSAASTVRDGSAHTPGPWRVSPLDGRTCGPSRLLIEQQSNTTIPQLQAVAIVTLRTGETAANARLIAASPDLFKACRDVLAQFDAGYFVRNTDSDGCSDWAFKAAEPLRALGAMKAAIAKAEGR